MISVLNAIFCSAHLESGFDEDVVVEGTDRRMDMSYFAAGILSNLLSSNTWDFEPTPAQVNDQLVRECISINFYE